MPPPGGNPSERARHRTRGATTPAPHSPTAPSSAPPRRAQTRKINPVTTPGAQCYPRLACALNESLLMHVQSIKKRLQCWSLSQQKLDPKRCKLMQGQVLNLTSPLIQGISILTAFQAYRFYVPQTPKLYAF